MGKGMEIWELLIEHDNRCKEEVRKSKMYEEDQRIEKSI